MNLWNIFKKKEITKPSEVEKEPVLRFYYEDYGFIYFSPGENKELIDRDTLKELQFKEKHFIKEGLNDFYIEAATQKILKNISERKIPLQTIDDLLIHLGFIGYKKVNRYSMHWEEEFYNTIGFELNGAKVFVEYKDGLINNLSFISLRPIEDESQLNKFTEFIYEVGTRWDLIMIDWISSKIINLNSKNVIRQYLNSD